MRRPTLRRQAPDGSANGHVALGLMLIGTGRTAGFAQFGSTTAAFLDSLSPPLGFAIVLSGVAAWPNHLLNGATMFLSFVCGLLAPAVIGELFCRLWQRQAQWAQYATVLNCGQWLFLAVAILAIPLASLGYALGLDGVHATLLWLSACGAYVLWFHWFVARHVLDVSRRRATAVMLCVAFGTGILSMAPSLAAGHRASQDPPSSAASPAKPAVR